MGARPLRLLLVEDDVEDAMIVQDLLDESAARVNVTHVMTLAEAVKVARGHDVALLDLNLPDASGLEALQKLRASADDMAILVLTGLADERRGIEAMAAGAQDYLVKGHVEPELLLRSIRYAVERRRAEDAQRQLTLERAQTEENTRLERGLLPTPLLSANDLEVATLYRAGRRRALLGGDFFDVVEDQDGSIHAIIGDVSGHGPDEAAVGVCLRIAWRTLMLAGTDAPSTLFTLQEVLEAERYAKGVFATVATLTLPADRAYATIRTAGHPSPLMLLPDGGSAPITERPGGPPLGVVKEAGWESIDVPLAPGWGVLLYTDGVFEGRRGEGRLGEDGLAEVLARARQDNPGRPNAALRQVVEQAESLNAGPLSDDVALVLIQS